MKIKCNCVGSILVCSCKDDAKVYEFETVPGDLFTIKIPEGCYIEFLPISVYPLW